MINLNKNRKSIRLKNYDYSESGDYFITICTQDRACLFGEIKDGEMILNEFGKIVETEILKTPKIRKNINIDIFCIMPNHVHIILTILCAENDRIDRRGDPLDHPEQAVHPNNRATQRVAPTLKPGTIGSIIGQIKSISSKKAGINFWQRNYYETIITNESAYNEIYTYIESNPNTWERDRNNPKNIK